MEDNIFMAEKKQITFEECLQYDEESRGNLGAELPVIVYRLLEYSLKDEYKEIKNLTLKIDSLALNIIKLIIVMITLILAFEINTLLGIGLFLIEFLYIIYKRNLEQQILESIKHLKDNVEMTTLDVLTERGKSGINILITLLILGLITNFNWSIVISFIVVFLFTIKDIYSNIK